MLDGPTGYLVGQAGTAVAGVFTLATTARTYVQLVEEEAEPREGTAHEREREQARAREPELETQRP